jgi:hypothetical protein
MRSHLLAQTALMTALFAALPAYAQDVSATASDETAIGKRTW